MVHRVPIQRPKKVKIETISKTKLATLPCMKRIDLEDNSDYRSIKESNYQVVCVLMISSSHKLV